MLEILRVRSVGVQLLLTTGSSSICTYEAESHRSAQVSFHWNRAIKIAVSFRYILPKHLSDERISFCLTFYFIFQNQISRRNKFNIVFNYIIIFYNLIILKKKFAKKEGEELEEKILLNSESKLSKKISRSFRTLEISAIKSVYASNNEFKNSELHSPYVFTRRRVSLGAGFIRRNSYHVVRDRSTTTVVATEEGRKITFCMRIAKSQETSIHSPLGEDGLRVHVRAPDP